MEESNIKKQHFHGGSMNGVCCRRLLDETDVIVEKIQLLVKDKVSKRKRDDNKKCVPLSELTKVLGTFKSLFECIDLVFCKLRILDPTVEEIEEIKIAIKGLEQVWTELDLSITPKMHILLKHTVDQVEWFGGIADKVEDFVEKSHQFGNKLNYLVARMKSQCFRQQELVKIRRQWLTSNPSVSKRIATVHKSNKRKRLQLTESPSNLHSSKIIKAKVKTEKRLKVLKSLFDTSEKNNCSSRSDISED